MENENIKREEVPSESGEDFLRREDAQAAFEEQPEVIELPPNIQRMQGKIESLRGEIGNLEAQFAQVQDALDTRVAALSWYSEQVMKHFEVAVAEND